MLSVGGGVSANSLLRSRLEKELKVPLKLTKLEFCGDNAAMIGKNCSWLYH
jgi:tRNA A37 threonylcarbamoyltransferase TsaD